MTRADFLPDREIAVPAMVKQAHGRGPKAEVAEAAADALAKEDAILAEEALAPEAAFVKEEAEWRSKRTKLNPGPVISIDSD